MPLTPVTSTKKMEIRKGFYDMSYPELRQVVRAHGLTHSLISDQKLATWSAWDLMQEIEERAPGLYPNFTKEIK